MYEVNIDFNRLWFKLARVRVIGSQLHKQWRDWGEVNQSGQMLQRQDLFYVFCVIANLWQSVSQSVSQSDQLFWQWIISLFPRVFLAEKPLCILFRIWLIWLDSYDKWKAPWACKSLAFGSRFTSFSSVLPTSQVGYHAGKPIVSVVYCFYKITLSFLWVYWQNEP